MPVTIEYKKENDCLFRKHCIITECIQQGHLIIEIPDRFETTTVLADNNLLCMMQDPMYYHNTSSYLGRITLLAF